MSELLQQPSIPAFMLDLKFSALKVCGTTQHAILRAVENGMSPHVITEGLSGASVEMNELGETRTTESREMKIGLEEDWSDTNPTSA